MYDKKDCFISTHIYAILFKDHLLLFLLLFISVNCKFLNYSKKALLRSYILISSYLQSLVEVQTIWYSALEYTKSIFLYYY